MTHYSVESIAQEINGTIEGNTANVFIQKLARIEDAQKGDITFLANPKYLSYIHTTKASVVIVNRDFESQENMSYVLIRVDNPYDAFTTLTAFFSKNKFLKTGVSKNAAIHENAYLDTDIYVGDFSVISENAQIGEKTQIYPHVYIGANVQIGKNTIVHPGVKIYDDCVIGSHCIIHAGVIIGSDGFGFAPQNNSTYNKIEQIGHVIIEDHVEIGANTTIDRAAIGATIIRKGVKLDNLLQIAHNVEIGENTVIAAQTGISGSTKIGKNCMIGGQVGIVGHLTIADNVKIAAQSGIQSSIKKEGAILQGSPAFEINEYKRAYACFKNLPKYFNLFYQIKT